jgi:hypothetical protein
MEIKEELTAFGYLGRKENERSRRQNGEGRRDLDNLTQDEVATFLCSHGEVWCGGGGIGGSTADLLNGPRKFS